MADLSRVGHARTQCRTLWWYGEKLSDIARQLDSAEYFSKTKSELQLHYFRAQMAFISLVVLSGPLTIFESNDDHKCSHSFNDTFFADKPWLVIARYIIRRHSWLIVRIFWSSSVMNILPDTKFMQSIILLFNTNFLLSFTVNNSLRNKKNFPIALKLQNVSLFLDWKFGINWNGGDESSLRLGQRSVILIRATMCTFLKHPLQGLQFA